MNDESAVTPWSSDRPAIEFDGGGQYEAVVIVGVLADQVHAAGRPVNACGGAEVGLECVQELVGRFQRAALSLICLIFGWAFVRRKPESRRLGVEVGCGTLLLRKAAQKILART